jgi:hypothetical protein
MVKDLTVSYWEKLDKAETHNPVELVCLKVSVPNEELNSTPVGETAQFY